MLFLYPTELIQVNRDFFQLLRNSLREDVINLLYL